MQNLKIILASASPRRRQILTLAGINHEVMVSNADETIEGAPDYQVRELALRKGLAVLNTLKPTDAIIISADTLVYINDKVLGKPKDKTHAFSMLKNLQGNPHKVYTGVALINVKTGEQKSFVDATTVYFHPLTDDDINAYIKTGEPFDKAGAYGIQERGAVLVDRIEGDYYTVVGLPISKVCKELNLMGYDVWGIDK